MASQEAPEGSEVPSKLKQEDSRYNLRAIFEPAERPLIATSGTAIDLVAAADPSDIQRVGAAQLSLSTSYYHSVLQQARRSFVAAISAAVAGFAFFIAAVTIILVKGTLSAGTVSAVAGGVVEVLSGLNFWLYSRTALQLDRFHLRLERMQRYLLANSLSTSLPPDHRHEVLKQLITVVSSDHPAAVANEGHGESSAKRED